MFETEIQKSWDRYVEDYGLGRILIFICLFNGFLFFYTGVNFNAFNLSILFPIILCFIFYFLRPKLIRLPPVSFLVLSSIPLIFSIAYNYHMIGYIDIHHAQFERLDPFFASFDFWLFGMLATELIESYLRPVGLLGVVLYDIMMVSYLFYFFLPFIGLYIYYSFLPLSQKYKVGRYMGSVVIFFCLNYMLYVLFPVTGPQYYVEDFFHADLPLSKFGMFLYQLVRDNHHTFIDCFPSGHFGMSLLVTFWLFRVNHGLRFLFVLISFSIMMATLSMRYHYVLDLVGSVPLALISYGLGKLLIPSKAQVDWSRKYGETHSRTHVDR